MAFDDILLFLDSYPDPTPTSAIDRAVELTARLGGKVTALGLQVDIPIKSNRVADYLIGLSKLEREEEAKSLAACQAGLAHFAASAKAAGVFAGAVIGKAGLYDRAEQFAVRARTRDLCMVPITGRFGEQVGVAHEAIFRSGRPVIVFDAEAGVDIPARAELGRIVIAWDASRSAARAMADALPILSLAREVRVLTVLGEKPSAIAGLGLEALRHLQTHGVVAVADEVDAGGEPIGLVLDRYIDQSAPDLLVMGAFGHSRLTEFIVGGATDHVLSRPKAPVFLSH